jgi:zinc/manganese transport system permease protein
MMLHWLSEPGLWSNPTVQLATVVGVVIATASACVGLFTVLRAQSFAGHALADVATAGGAAAGLVAWPAVVGFVAGSLAGAGAMEALGLERLRQRDVATGVVLGAATGVSALLLYLISLHSSSAGATKVILFGSLFSVTPATAVVVFVVSTLIVLGLAMLSRPLLFASLSPDAASARGVRVTRLGLVFSLVMAVTVGLSAIVLGAVLSTALLIGPPAAALRLGRGLRATVLAGVALATVAVVVGVAASYDSFYWWPSHRALPVSSCVVAVVVAELGVATALRHRRRRREM